MNFDFEIQNERALALARALTINLGLSLCSLFRGDLPLHAAGIEIDGKLIGIMAPSGIGKSTLLWLLLEQGERFANDDVIPLKFRQNSVIAIPSMSLHSKLSKMAFEARGLDWKQFQETLPGEEEFWIPIEQKRRLLEPRPLAALFVLRPFHRPELPGHLLVRRQVGPVNISFLMEFTQGLWAVNRQVDAPLLLSHYLAVAKSVPIYTVEYHRCLEALPEIVKRLRGILSEPLPQQVSSAITQSGIRTANK